MKYLAISLNGMIISGISYLFGGIDAPLITLCIFMIIDYITGITNAIFVKKNLSSQIGFFGIVKKILILALIVLATLLEQNIGISGIRLVVLIWYIGNEGISILENLVSIGLPVPVKIKEILESFQNESRTNVKR